jgi:sugar phosphate isomerase/epimerase
MTSMSRRRFIRRSGGLLTAALLADALPRSTRADPLGRPVGIQLWAVKDVLREDPAGTLETLRGIGYGEVETAGFGKLSAREFRKLLDDSGLKCPSAHLSFDRTNLGPTFDDAHALGTQYVASGSLRSSLQPPIPFESPGMSIEEAKHTAELANLIGEKAAQAGLQYAYHNHNLEFGSQGGQAGFDILLRETDLKLVKFEIDCGWMVVGGRNPIDYFKKFPGRFPMIHVKDFLPSPPTQAADGGKTEHPGAELGKGMIDYRPIFAAARTEGVRHYFVEQEGPFVRMSQLDAARQAYAYLHAMR